LSGSGFYLRLRDRLLRRRSGKVVDGWKGGVTQAILSAKEELKRPRLPPLLKITSTLATSFWASHNSPYTDIPDTFGLPLPTITSQHYNHLLFLVLIQPFVLKSYSSTVYLKLLIR
jgi:hypothetical protein